MFPKSPKHAEQIEILAVCEKSVATRWRMETEAMKISVTNSNTGSRHSMVTKLRKAQ